jgi:hypothetical protein
MTVSELHEHYYIVYNKNSNKQYIEHTIWCIREPFIRPGLRAVDLPHHPRGARRPPLGAPERRARRDRSVHAGPGGHQGRGSGEPAPCPTGVTEVLAQFDGIRSASVRTGVKDVLILVANSEIRSVYLRQVLENRSCQLSRPRENEFATSIRTSFTSVGSEANRVAILS